jgi:hypothetical protein
MSAEHAQAYLSLQPDCLRFLQTNVLELGVPEFCVFNDMYAFDMQLRVGQPPQSVPLPAGGENEEA